MNKYDTKKISEGELDTRDFYIDKLKWDTKIWDLKNSNYELEIYPTLKLNVEVEEDYK